jgi:hypothetical protein
MLEFTFIQTAIGFHPRAGSDDNITRVSRRKHFRNAFASTESVGLLVGEVLCHEVIPASKAAYALVDPNVVSGSVQLRGPPVLSGLGAMKAARVVTSRRGFSLLKPF